MNKQKITEVIATTLIVLVAIWLTGIFTPVKIPLGGQEGARLGAASTTLYALTGTAIQAMSTTSCATRIVTTGVAAVALSFFDQPLDGTHLGKYQAASTTVAYDSGTYGCGGMKARSANGATQLEITDAN